MCVKHWDWEFDVGQGSLKRYVYVYLTCMDAIPPRPEPTHILMLPNRRMPLTNLVPGFMRSGQVRITVSLYEYIQIYI